MQPVRDGCGDWVFVAVGGRRGGRVDARELRVILHLVDDELVEVAVVQVPDGWPFPYRTARARRPFGVVPLDPGTEVPRLTTDVDEWWPIAIDDTSAICRRRPR